MNKLFGIVFTITFLVSQSNFYLFSIIGVIALFVIAPLTAPENIGK